jgi:hypothetical protein
MSIQNRLAAITQEQGASSSMNGGYRAAKIQNKINTIKSGGRMSHEDLGFIRGMALSGGATSGGKMPKKCGKGLVGGATSGGILAPPIPFSKFAKKHYTEVASMLEQSYPNLSMVKFNKLVNDQLRMLYDANKHLPENRRQSKPDSELSAWQLFIKNNMSLAIESAKQQGYQGRDATKQAFVILSAEFKAPKGGKVVKNKMVKKLSQTPLYTEIQMGGRMKKMSPVNGKTYI